MQASKNHYYSYPILEKDTPFYHPSNENSNNYQHYHSQRSSSSFPYSLQQNQEPSTTDIEETTRRDEYLAKKLEVELYHMCILLLLIILLRADLLCCEVRHCFLC